MRRLLLVANPAASGFTASLHRDVVEILERTFAVVPIWPNGPAEARAEAEQAAAGGFDVVAAMGGDGVVHQVANGVIGSDSAIAVIPAGTTNVFRRLAGYPAKPRDAAEAVAASAGVRPMPVLTLSEGDERGMRSHVATFAAGVGFDAEVIRESDRHPLRKIGFGSLHYVRSVLKVTVSDFRHRLPTLRVVGAGRSADAVAVQFQVQEEYTYLSRIPLRLSSGPFPAATVLEQVGALKMLHAVARAALRQDVAKVKGIDVWEGFRRIEIEADPPAWVEADGELLGKASTVVASPDPRPLRIVAA